MSVGYIGEGSEVLEVSSPTFQFLLPRVAALFRGVGHQLISRVLDYNARHIKLMSLGIDTRESRSTYYLINHVMYLLLPTAVP